MTVPNARTNLEQLPTTLQVPVNARDLFCLQRKSELPALMELAASRGRRLRFIGEGSNLVPRSTVDSLVCVVRTRGFEILDSAGDQVLVRAAAGERWHEFVRWTVAQGFSGIENLALIPGTVGAAPVQNIGAYGVELADIFESAHVYDCDTGRESVWSAARCAFAYRDSCFKQSPPGRYLILGLTLRLSRNFQGAIHYPDVALALARQGQSKYSARLLMETVIRIRRVKLPDVRRVGNVGSFFKNPVVSATFFARHFGSGSDWACYPTGLEGEVKLAAAQLIDRAGLKSATFGAVGLWPRQPLVLFNRGGAVGEDFLAAAREIQVCVQDRFGVTLEMEPDILS